MAPIRRVDLALKFIADAIKEATFSNPKPIEEHMAEQLILAASNDPAAPSGKKKTRIRTNSTSFKIIFQVARGRFELPSPPIHS